MKLLLDEQVPVRLARSFPEQFEVRTVRQMGWASVKNGALLRLAAENGFRALVSADKNMEYQQNLKELAIPVIVLTAKDNRLPALQPLVPGIVRLFDETLEPDFYHVNA